MRHGSTQRVHAYLFESVADVFEGLPQVRNAVSPEPSTKRANADRFDVPTEFRRRAAGFGLPTPSGAELVETYVFGDCLAPILEHGDRLWFDPGRAARDGDVVLACWSPATFAFIREHAEARAFEEANGFRVPPVLVKFLFHFDGGHVLADNSTGLPLDDARVLGTLVRAERAGQPIHGGA